MGDAEFTVLLHQARCGEIEPLGELLEKHRPYLKIMAARGLDASVQGRVDPSDVVQVSFLEACRDFRAFRGQGEAEFVVWLRRIVEHNVSQTIEKHVFTKKRSTNSERRLDDSASRGASPKHSLAADESTPSQRAMRGEDAVRLSQWLDLLPADQREALRLRYLEGWTLMQLTEHFQRSEDAVAGLLKRGLRALRKRHML